jgi:hypothetical protein
LRHYKELRPKVSQLSRTGHYTQVPRAKPDECNGDFAPTSAFWTNLATQALHLK